MDDAPTRDVRRRRPPLRVGRRAGVGRAAARRCTGATCSRCRRPAPTRVDGVELQPAAACGGGDRRERAQRARDAARERRRAARARALRVRPVRSHRSIPVGWARDRGELGRERSYWCYLGRLELIPVGVDRRFMLGDRPRRGMPDQNPSSGPADLRAVSSMPGARACRPGSRIHGPKPVVLVPRISGLRTSPDSWVQTLDNENDGSKTSGPTTCIADAPRLSVLGPSNVAGPCEAALRCELEAGQDVCDPSSCLSGPRDHLIIREAGANPWDRRRFWPVESRATPKRPEQREMTMQTRRSASPNDGLIRDPRAGPTPTEFSFDAPGTWPETPRSRRP